MSSNISISLHNVGKTYTIYDKPQDRIKDAIISPFGKRYGTPFRALSNISFSAEQGQAIGVIGRNGSGKSTLLQLIAGVLTPTEGTVTTNGRITSLLELGSGFNPEFTGRENVFMNGSILGMTTREINDRLPEILDFADIGDFIDQPVKLYSSGMMVRLAFAVQSCVNPRILIVDEALSVGDIFFQQKCHAHMASLLKNGATIILVTHDMAAIERYSDRVLLLDKGKCIFNGNPNDAVQRYFWTCRPKGTPEPERIAHVELPQVMAGSNSGSDFSDWPKEMHPIDENGKQTLGGQLACFRTLNICDAFGKKCRVFEMGDSVIIYTEVEALATLRMPCVGVVITNSMNINVYGKQSVQAKSKAPAAVTKGTHIRIRHEIKLNLAPGEYTFDLGVSDIDHADYLQADKLRHAELVQKYRRCCQLQRAGAFQIIPKRHGMEMPFLGICDLPASHELSIVDKSDLQK